MKRSILLIFSVTLIAFIAACDSGGGGGSERFSTVEVFASYEADTYTADSIVWEDTDGDGFCDAAGFTDDDATATVTSTAYNPLPDNVDPSAVNILRYTVSYIPQTASTPDFPAKRINHQFTIPAPGLLGSVAVDVPIRIFDVSDKAGPLAGAQVAEYKYTVKVSLRMEEVSTGIGETVEFKFPLRIFNVTDDCN